MRKLKLPLIAALAGLAGTSLTAAGQAAQSQPAFRNITVTIHRLAATDNLDGDVLKKDNADFYAKVTIGGYLTKTEVMSKDDARPNWVIREAVTGSVVPITIQVFDDDGGLEDKDDHVDINPRERVKDLNLWLDTNTGRIRGDATGVAGTQIMSRGGGKDSDKARIWFTVNYQ